MATTTGTVDIIVGQETYQTWYKVVGDLGSGLRPLVVLHGGPGMTHDYFLPNTDLHVFTGMPIIFYDQVGNGQSTHLDDKPKEFWTVPLFMDEMENLLTKLGVAGEFDLLGHSWGGALAIDLRSSVSPKLWVEGARTLLKQFPKNFVDMTKHHKENGTTDEQEYQDGMQQFYKKHVITLSKPFPEEIAISVGALHGNPTVYGTMWGPSEFFNYGVLKDWSVVEKLEKTKYPVLITNGVEDECQDICVLPFFEKLPTVKWYQFAKSTHMSFWEERKRYIEVVSRYPNSH